MMEEISWQLTLPPFAASKQRYFWKSSLHKVTQDMCLLLSHYSHADKSRRRKYSGPKKHKLQMVLSHGYSQHIFQVPGGQKE